MTPLSRGLLGSVLVAGAAFAGWMFLPSFPAARPAHELPGLGSEVAPPGDAGTSRSTASTASQAAVATAPTAPVAPVAPIASSAPPAPIVALSGVVIGAAGGNLAIVSLDHRPEVLLRVGDVLWPSATVVRIDEDSMTYRVARLEHRVSVKPAPKVAATSAPAVPPLAAPPRHLPGFVADAPGMARAGGLQAGSGNEAFRQAVAKKMQAIAADR